MLPSGTMKLNWRFFLLVIPIAVCIVAVFLGGVELSDSAKIWFLLFTSPVVFLSVALIGYEQATPWNILILGDENIARLFEKNIKPKLTKKFKRKSVNVYLDIANKQFDVLVLAFNLATIGNADSIKDAERKAVEHFGGAVFRHIILIAGYDRTFSKPNDLLSYINKNASDHMKKLCEKNKRMLLPLRVNPRGNQHQETDNQVNDFQRKAEDINETNCGPFKHRVIILGGRKSGKHMIGNMILSGNLFDEDDRDECIAEERFVSGRSILVVNTPAVKKEDRDKRDSENQKAIGKCLLLTSPGPRVFILVVNQNDSEDEISAGFDVFENRFGVSSYSQLIVILRRNMKDESIPNPIQTHLEYFGQRLIIDCGDSAMREGNKIQKRLLSLITMDRIESTKTELSLVLVGPKNVGKSYTSGNLLGLTEDENIFGKDDETTERHASVAMRRVGEFDVVVVDTPSLGVGSDGEVIKEIKRCAYLPGNRPRPIALLLRVDRKLGSSEEKFVKRIMSSLKTRKYLLIWTHEDMKDPKPDTSVEKLLSVGQWHCLTFNINERRRLAITQNNNPIYMMVQKLMEVDVKETWNLLALGDKHMKKIFERFVKPQLARTMKDKGIRVCCTQNGTIESIPYDTIILVVDLASIKTPDNDLCDVWNDVETAKKHFGEAVFRHIILIGGYERNSPVFDQAEDISAYIEQYAPEATDIGNLFEKCGSRIPICMDQRDNTRQIQQLKKRIDQLHDDNCGPVMNRIILLGGGKSKKGAFGNIILNDFVFKDSDLDECIPVKRVVEGKRIMVVNTPSIKPYTDAKDRNSLNQRKISECILLTSPGPRVFIMVISENENPDDISCYFKFFNNRFGSISVKGGWISYRHFSNLIVVLKTGQGSTTKRIREILHREQKKYKLSNLQQIDYEPTADRNVIRGKILSMIKDHGVETTKKELSLVLIGPSKMGVSFTAGSLLGLSQADNVFSSDSQVTHQNISVAMRSFENFELVVVDTPGLVQTDVDDVVCKEIKEKCAYLPANKSLRPMAVVLRCDQPLRPNEVNCLSDIEKTFEYCVSKTMVIFTRKHFMELQRVGETKRKKDLRMFLYTIGRRRGPLKSMLSACHWRCVAYENKYSDITVPRMQQQRDTVYSLLERISTGSHDLRMVLVGYTGSGKSSCGNTIMSKSGVFNETFSLRSNTEECQVEEFEAFERKVMLVDTPGLFDKRLSYDKKETLTELVKFIVYTYPGPDAFLFPINAQSRLTGDVKGTLKILKDILGEKIFRHMVVILTRRDALEKEGKTPEQYISEIGKAEITTEFFDKNGEYVAFNNRLGSHRDAKELIEAVERTMAANEYSQFRCDAYANVMKRVNDYFNAYSTAQYATATSVTAAGVGAAGLLAGTGIGIPASAVVSAATAYYASRRKYRNKSGWDNK